LSIIMGQLATRQHLLQSSVRLYKARTCYNIQDS